MDSCYLFPGKLAAFRDETVISTLLGSCVAVAIFDPVAKVGGLNHYLLSRVSPGDVATARYGEFAIPELISEVEKLGGQRRRMEAKIYGGARVINGSEIGSAIGDKNIEFAKLTLAAEKIQIVAHDVGGEQARTIKFNTATGVIILNITKSSTPGTGIDVSGFRTLSVVKNVKVLIVDDSATVRNLFSNIFSKNGLEVVGAVADAYQARDLIASKKPDVLTLDIEMPKMSGVMFLEKLMKHHPIPVVMVSSLGSTGEAALRALELGAIEFVHKPSQFDPNVLRELATELVDKVKAAATVNLLKTIKSAPRSVEQPTPGPEHTSKRKKRSELRVVTVGGNAGSADAITTFIASLAQDTPPVVIACSTISSFITAYLQKIKPLTKLSLSIAKDGELLQVGRVYFVPDGYHGKILNSPAGPMIKFDKSQVSSTQMPSANVLFESAANAYAGGIYAVLFGGFGLDGVDGLGKVQAKGGCTVAQHPEQAQFPFAPQKAIELGYADEILKAESISKSLMNYRNQSVY